MSDSIIANSGKTIQVKDGHLDQVKATIDLVASSDPNGGKCKKSVLKPEW